MMNGDATLQPRNKGKTPSFLRERIVKTYTGEFKYLLGDVIGGGHTAQVFRAVTVSESVSHKKGEVWAVKVAREDSLQLRNRFISEHNLLRQLWDNGARQVPRIDSLDRTEGEPVVLVMEFVDLRLEKGTAKRLLDYVSARNSAVRERLCVDAAVQYVELLQTLHRIGRAAPDRKLGDLLWDENRIPQLIVLDWNVVPISDESGRRHDLNQFGSFWYELMLGTPPPSESDRDAVKPEDHPAWEEFTWGMQQIVRRALRKGTPGYTQAGDLLRDLQNERSLIDTAPQVLLGLGRESLANCMLKREESPLEALASAEKALVSLDVIRVFRPSSDEYGSAQELFGQGRKAREELSSGLSQRAISDLRNGFYGKAIAEIERVRQMHGETHGSSHEIERWRLLARFGQSLGEEEMLFREHILPVLAGDHSEHALAARPGVIQCLETGELESVRKQFWDMLQTAFNAQVLQLAFSQALEDARNALSAGRLFETMSHLGSARISLTAGGGHPASNDDEERESTAMTLFAKLYAEETGLLYIICEAEARSQDHQARELCGKHEFNQAKSVYDRIDRIRRLIPYELELEKAGLLAPRYFAMEQVGKLSRTAEESNKCLRTALGLMEQENFADAWNELNRGLSLASVGVPEEQPASLYWSGQARADLVGGLTKERERARLSLVLQQIIESPGLPEVLPAACLALEHLRQWEDRRESTWGARQHERIKQALKMEFDTRAGSFNLESIGILDLAKRYFVADNDIRSLLPQWESLLVGLFEKDVEALKQAGNVDKLRLPQDLTCMSKSLELTLDRYPSMLRLENVSAQSALLASKSKVTEMIDRVQGDIRKQRELRGEYEAARSRNLHHARAILDNARTVKLELYDSPEMSLASLTSEIEKELDQIDSLRKEDLFREAELAINNGQFELAKDFFERVSQEFDVSDWSREVDRRSDNLKNQSSRYEQLERKRHELESKLQIPISTWELGKLSELENANARLVSVQSECDEVLADWPRDLLSEQSVLHKSFANLSKTIRERRIAWFDCLLGLIEADLRARDWVSADEKYGFASAVSRGLYDTEDGASKLYRLNADIAVLRDRWLSRPSSEDQAAWEGLPTVEEGSLVEIAVGRLATLLALHATKTLEPTLEALESREAQRLDRLRAEVLYRDARDRAQKEPNAALDITNQAVELADHLSFAPWWKGAAEELQRGLKTQIDKANAGQTKRNDEEYRQLESQIRDLVQKGHYSEAKEKAESFRQLVSPRLEENLRSLRGDIEYFASVDSRFEALHGQSPSILIDLATSAKELDPHTKGWIEEYLAFHKDVTLKRLPAMLRDRIIEFDHSILENTKHKKTGDRMSARVRFKEFDDLKKQKPWEGE